MLNKFKIQNETGSTMVLVIVVMTVIIIIGTTLATVGLNALKLTYYTAFQNNAFYANDALVQEILYELDDITYGAEHAAFESLDDGDYKNKTNTGWNWDTFQGLLREAEQKAPTDAGYKSRAEIIAMVEEILELEFKKAYLNYILDGNYVIDDYVLYTGADGNETLTSRSDYKLALNPALSLDVNSINIDNTLLKDLDDNTFTSTGNLSVQAPTTTASLQLTTHQKITTSDNFGTIELMVNTEGGYNDVTKQMAFGASIQVPKYTFVVKLEEAIDFYENDLLNYAIAAQGNILALGGETMVNGDLYSYGTYPAEARFKTNRMGGVLAGYDSAKTLTTANLLNLNPDYLDQMNAVNPLWNQNGELVVTGNIGTHSAIKVEQDNSSIKCSGNTYSEFVIVEDKSVNASIDIDGNAYLYQDVLVRSSDGKINVEDDIWCFFNGDPAGTHTDRSGSIIVNPDSVNNMTGEKITANNVYVNGVAYMTALKNGTDFYKTNESLSNAKFSWFYSQDMSLETGDNESLFEENQIKFVEYVNEYEDPDDPNDNTTILAEKESGGTDEEFLYKKFYEVYRFNNYTTINEEERNKINITSIADDAYDKNYAHGLALSDGKVRWRSEYGFSPNMSSSNMGEGVDFIQYDDFTKATGEMNKELNSSKMDYRTSLLGRRDYLNNQNDYKDYNDGTASMFNSFINSEVAVTNRIFERYYDQLFFHNSEEEVDLFINKPDALSIKSEDQYLNNVTAINGVIITEGDVYIYAGPDSDDSVTINGTIVAKGDVILYGPGEKNVNYNKNTVYSIIGQDYDYVDLIHGLEGKAFKGGTLDTPVDFSTAGYVYKNEFMPFTTPNSGGTAYTVQAINPDFDEAVKNKNSKGYWIEKWHER